MKFHDHLRERAARRRLRIGFPEGRESRTRAALRILACESALQPVLVERRETVADLLEEVPGVELLDLADPRVGEQVRASLPAGATDAEPPDPLFSSVALLAAGRLDGVVAGAQHATAEVVRAGLRLLGTAPGTQTVSGAFYMVVRGPDAREHVLTFVDSAVVPHPSPAQLAEIAESAVRSRRLVVGDEPRVAFLSYSTHGSAGGESVERVRAALEAFRNRRPDVLADGELQVDAALDPEVARRKAPGSPVAGAANVLVFPDLDAGNIGYKLVRQLGGARALGPILLGLAATLNDLSRGAAVDEIVQVAYITALMAAGAGEG